MSLKKTSRRAARWLLLVAALPATGCQHCGWWGSPCNDFAHGAVEAPAGTYNAAWQREQAARAEYDFFVFYQYEWLGDSEQLSPFGQRHLARVLHRAQTNPLPLVVEPSGIDELDGRRVAAMQTALAQCDVTAAGYPVILGHSTAEPLYGLEAPLVTQGFLFGGGGGQGGGRGGIGGGGGRGGGLGGGGVGGGGFGGGGFGGGRGF